MSPVDRLMTKAINAVNAVTASAPMKVFLLALGGRAGPFAGQAGEG